MLKSLARRQQALIRFEIQGTSAMARLVMMGSLWNDHKIAEGDERRWDDVEVEIVHATQLLWREKASWLSTSKSVGLSRFCHFLLQSQSHR